MDIPTLQDKPMTHLFEYLRRKFRFQASQLSKIAAAADNRAIIVG